MVNESLNNGGYDNSNLVYPISDKVITISKPTSDAYAGTLYANQTLGNWFLIIMLSFGLLLIWDVILIFCDNSFAN